MFDLLVSILSYIRHIQRNGLARKKEIPFKSLKDLLHKHPNKEILLSYYRNNKYFTKSDVIKSAIDIIDEKATQYQLSTSGTTGAGLIVPFTRYAKRQMETAFHKQMVIMFGSADKRWRYQFSGQKIPSITGSVSVKCNFQKKILLDQYSLSEKNIEKYYHNFKKYKVDWLHGYPSSILILKRLLEAKYHKDVGKELGIKVISVSSEKITSDETLELTKFFGCKVYNYYCQTEAVASLFSCRLGNLHIDTDFSEVKFIKSISEKNTCFEIVGTSLINEAFPLVNYRTGDYVEQNLS